MRETLDSVVTPSVRDTIIARALFAAGLPELPTEPHTFEDFLQGPLHHSLVKALGQELGTSVSNELERITLLAVKDAVSRTPSTRRQADTVRPGGPKSQPPATGKSQAPGGRKSQPPGARRKRSTLPSPEVLPPGSVVSSDQQWAEKERRGIAPTLPAARRVGVLESADPGRPSGQPSVSSKGPQLPVSADYPRGVAQALGVFGTASVDPRPSRRPTVLLASTNPEQLRLFQAWLDLRATVEPAVGATHLLERLALVGGPRTVIVFDGKNPGIRPLSLAALADELPAGTTVILWGVQPHLHARMCNISAAAEKWIVYAGDATSNDIVAKCAKIVE